MIYRGLVIILVGLMLVSTVLVIDRAESSEVSVSNQAVFQGNATPTHEPDDHRDGEDHAEDDHMDDMDSEHMDDEVEYSPEMIAAGKQVFTQYACFACHGENGEGTDLAPALANHDPETVRRQVRMPSNNMPVFPPSALSSEDVDALIAFISSLEIEGGGHAHEHSGNSIGDLMVEHHWLAREAMMEENYEEAVHQINHIIEIATGPHLLAMQTMLDQVNTEEYDSALQTLNDMLYEIEVQDVDTDIAHLQLALAWVISENADNALHNLEHVGDYSEDEHILEATVNIMALIEAEEWHEAQDALIALLPDTEHEHDEVMEEHDDEHEDEHHSDEEGEHHNDEHSEDEEHTD